MEFLKSHITEEWMDLFEDFPEFVFELSRDVYSWWQETLIFAKSEDQMPPELSELCNLRYGAECDIGWKNLIREYFLNIRALINEAKENGDEIHYKCCILKEKLGELRDQGDFYGPDYKKYSSRYQVLSSELKIASRKVCEVCGESGDIRRLPWIKTLCNDHYNTRITKNS